MEVETDVDVKKAVRSSLEYIKEIYENQEQLRDLRLEEVELIGDGGSNPFWLVTLSFVRPVSEPVSAWSQIATQVIPAVVKYQRVYKTFNVDAKSGKVKSMKIREL